MGVQNAVMMNYVVQIFHSEFIPFLTFIVQ